MLQFISYFIFFQSIVGTLEGCSKTGRLVVRDNTATIEIVSSCWHGDTGLQQCVQQQVLPSNDPMIPGRDNNEASERASCGGKSTSQAKEHDITAQLSSGNTNNSVLSKHHKKKSVQCCSTECNCERLTSGDHFLCPYVHVCCLGKLVYIGRYQTVTERQVDRQQQCKNRTYLMVDMRDVIYLGDTRSTGEDRATISGNRNHLGSENKSPEFGTGQSTGIKSSVGTIDVRNEKCQLTACANKGIAESGSQRQCRSDKTRVDNDFNKAKRDTDSQRSALHRHVKPEGGVAYCRKKDCLANKTLPHGDCVPVLEHIRTRIEDVDNNSSSNDCLVNKVTGLSRADQKTEKALHRKTVITPKYSVIGKHAKKRKLEHQWSKEKQLSESNSVGTGVNNDMKSGSAVKDQSTDIPRQMKPTDLSKRDEVDSGLLVSKATHVGQPMVQGNNENVCRQEVETIKDLSQVGVLTEVIVYIENKGSVLSEVDTVGERQINKFITECDLVLGKQIFKVQVFLFYSYD